MKKTLLSCIIVTSVFLTKNASALDCISNTADIARLNNLFNEYTLLLENRDISLLNFKPRVLERTKIDEVVSEYTELLARNLNDPTSKKQEEVAQAILSLSNKCRVVGH